MAEGQHQCLEVKSLDEIFLSNGKLRYDNIDIALTRAYPSALEVAKVWLRKGWVRNPNLWGPLGTELHKVLTELGTSSEFQALSEDMQAVQYLITSLGTADKHFESRVPLVWLGSPATASQIMAAIQLKSKEKHPEWPGLPVQLDVLLIEEVSEINRECALRLRQFANEQDIPAGTAAVITSKVKRAKAKAINFNFRWQGITAAADSSTLEELIAQIKEAELPPANPDPAYQTEVGNRFSRLSSAYPNRERIRCQQQNLQSSIIFS